MPRSLQEILDHADEMACRFEDNDDPGVAQGVAGLRRVRDAAAARAAAEREVSEAVAAAAAAAAAREARCSWATIAAMLGTSGEAVRQRYGARSDADAEVLPDF